MLPSVSSSLQIIEQDNRCSSLLSLEIQVKAAHEPQASNLASDDHEKDDHEKSEVETFDIYLSLSAGHHWQDLADGKVQVAIAQATLTLSLTDARFIPAKTWPTPEQEPFQLTGAETGLDEAGHPSEATFTIASASAPLLRGELQTVNIGQVHAHSSSWSLMAIAQTPAQHVCITDAEGLWRHDITPNKYGIIERRLAISLHESLLSPHLCRLHLCHACPDPLPTIEGHSLDLTPPALDEDDLKETIQSILDAPTSNLLDLAQRAGLVVETDLSRISLRGASLSGLDLSNVDLSYANLRGADLTDAELSEANISRAKLGGADLSGAYLGSADLSYCDLHRASLALANLSGANLSHANVQDANLSQTNLNGVQVYHAQFSGQSVLPAELRASLKERGAIFQ